MNSVVAAPGRPDRALYEEARQALVALRASPKVQERRGEWEKIVMRFRRVVARYPQSGYCDDALLAVGDLYREMAQRFKAPRYKDDAVQAYHALVDEYPSSRLGDPALFAAFEIAREAGERKRVGEAARDYLEAYPDGQHARDVKTLMRRSVPSQAASIPSPPPPGLARVFDLRFWTGESSTRVVVYLEKQVAYHSERIDRPDRLFIDLSGTRLHPNLTRRSFPLGNGLLEQVRIAQNKDDVVRVVLDFRDVKEHNVVYLQDPTRLVVDVRGAPPPQRAVASADKPAGDAEAGTASNSADAEKETPAATQPTAAPNTSAAKPVAAATLPPQPPQQNRAGSYSIARQLGLGARRIVIDAGHGGHDPGSIGQAGLQEKDLVLDVALRLEAMVRSDLKADVVMTRSTDVFVPLEERTAIANSKAADLFLSIHANSSRNAAARGIETYFLNFAADPQAEEVAARENAISTATLKDLQGLVKAITLNGKIDESRDFAASIQDAMVDHLRPVNRLAQNRGVHTAPFYVLVGANMPSVLAEIAFVSHPEEERLLKTSEYRERIARSLLQGVRSYLDALSRTQTRQLTGMARPSTVIAKGER